MCDLRKGFDLLQCICNKAPRFTFKGLLFNLHHHRAHSKAHNISSSPPRLAYTSIRLICPLFHICVDNFSQKKYGTTPSLTPTSSSQMQRRVARFFHLRRYKSVTSLIVTLSITLISSSLPQLSLGTCDCTSSMRTKLLWLCSSCCRLNSISPLETEWEKKMHLPFQTGSRLLSAANNIPQSQNNC